LDFLYYVHELNPEAIKANKSKLDKNLVADFSESENAKSEVEEVSISEFNDQRNPPS